jgi:hypothetical protein
MTNAGGEIIAIDGAGYGRADALSLNQH